MPSLLFVCHANIARSASAELLAQQRVGADTSWQVASAGVTALSGHPIDSDLAAALQRRGIDTSAHRARQADEAMLAEADLVLVFETCQRAWVLQESPSLIRSTFTIRRAARVLQGLSRRAEPFSFLAVDNAPYTSEDDFADPYGQGPEAAEAAVAEIAALLDIVLPAVGAVPRPSAGAPAAALRRRRIPREVGA